MTPRDDQTRTREAFNALPEGTPPPGLDTRIRAAAHEAANKAASPRRGRAPILFGSLATVALAALLIRPLWLAAPDPRETLGTSSTAAETTAQANSTDSTGESGIRSGTQNKSAAAVADTRGSTFDAARSIGSSTVLSRTTVTATAAADDDTLADLQVLSESAMAAPVPALATASEPIAAIAADITEDAAPEADNAAAPSSSSETIESSPIQGFGANRLQLKQGKSVPPGVWWQQILTLLEYGHTTKAQKEYRLLTAAHPTFKAPKDTPTEILLALDIPH